MLLLHSIGVIVAITLLGTPNFLLAGLIGVYGLGEGRGGGRKGTACVLVLVAVTTAAASARATKAEGEVQTIALLLLVVHGERDREWVSRSLAEEKEEGRWWFEVVADGTSRTVFGGALCGPVDKRGDEGWWREKSNALTQRAGLR